MEFTVIADELRDIPHLTRAQGGRLYWFIVEQKPRCVLELGYAHGVSACYMAAALEENGGGEIYTIDIPLSDLRRPTIRELSARLRFQSFIRPVTVADGYIWELQRLLRDPGAPRFDFVFIDGAHLWEVDGFAFFLADRLLEPGGWMLFDDLDWTLDRSPSLKGEAWVREIPSEQRRMAQIGAVFELLVAQHPDYTTWQDGGWGWARKHAHGLRRFTRRRRAQLPPMHKPGFDS